MANTRQTILDALVSEIEDLSSVRKATRDLITPEQARGEQPYIGVIASQEVVQAEDATHVLWELAIDLFVVVLGDLEEVVDELRTLLFDTSTAATIGAKYITMHGMEPVAYVAGMDGYTSVRISVTILYSSEKGAF